MISKPQINGIIAELYKEAGQQVQQNEVIAVIGQKMFSIHDKYCIDIYRAEEEEKVVAILVTLQHMMKDRAAASSASYSSGSSSN